MPKSFILVISLRILLNTSVQSKLINLFFLVNFSFLPTWDKIECFHILLHPLNLFYMKEQLPQSSASV